MRKDNFDTSQRDSLRIWIRTLTIVLFSIAGGAFLAGFILQETGVSHDFNGFLVAMFAIGALGGIAVAFWGRKIILARDITGFLKSDEGRRERQQWKAERNAHRAAWAESPTLYKILGWISMIFVILVPVGVVLIIIGFVMIGAIMVVGSIGILIILGLATQGTGQKSQDKANDKQPPTNN